MKNTPHTVCVLIAMPGRGIRYKPPTSPLLLDELIEASDCCSPTHPDCSAFALSAAALGAKIKKGRKKIKSTKTKKHFTHVKLHNSNIAETKTKTTPKNANTFRLLPGNARRMGAAQVPAPVPCGGVVIVAPPSTAGLPAVRRGHAGLAGQRRGRCWRVRGVCSCSGDRCERASHGRRVRTAASELRVNSRPNLIGLHPPSRNDAHDDTYTAVTLNLFCHAMGDGHGPRRAVSGLTADRS